MNLDKELSKNFRLIEFVRSETARRLKIDNTPTDEIVTNLVALCENVLEPLREIAKAPIKILSGYRCLELNTAVGGSKESQHMLGQAADLRIANQTVRDSFELIKGSLLKFDQLIEEKFTPENEWSGWIHISWNTARKNRKEAIRIP